MTNDRVSTRLNTLRSLHNALVTNGTIPSNIGDMLRNQLPSESHVDLVKNAAMRDAQMANENAPMPWANSILGSAAYAVASLPVHVAQKVSELLASKDPHEVAAGVKFLDDTAQKHYQNVEDDATGVASLDPEQAIGSIKGAARAAAVLPERVAGFVPDMVEFGKDSLSHIVKNAPRSLEIMRDSFVPGAYEKHIGENRADDYKSPVSNYLDKMDVPFTSDKLIEVARKYNLAPPETDDPNVAIPETIFDTGLQFTAAPRLLSKSIKSIHSLIPESRSMSTKLDTQHFAVGGLTKAAKKLAETAKKMKSTNLPSLRALPVAEGIKVASKQPHLIESGAGSEGLYVGGPRNMLTRQDLTNARRAFDAYVAKDPRGGDWYHRYRAGLAQMTGNNPLDNDWASKMEGQWSAGVDPFSEFSFAIKENNAALMGDPVKAAYPDQHKAFLNALANNDPTLMQLGKKTGEYASKVSPDQFNPPSATGVNDFRHAQNWGYTEPSGKPQRAGLGDAQMNFLDYETALAVKRANEKGLGGRTDWTGEDIQAAPWVRQKAEAFMSRNKNLSYEDAFKRANTTIADAAPRHTFFATYEAQPGRDIGHLQGSVNAPEEERWAYAADPRSTWKDPLTGRDLLYSGLRYKDTGVAARVLPSLEMTGMYQPPQGPLETNPGEVARPLVGMKTLGKGEKEIDPASRTMVNLGEATRAYIDAQLGGAGHMPITGGPAGKSRSLFLPKNGPASKQELLDLKALGSKYGLGDVVDTGQGITMTSFYPDPPLLKRKESKQLMEGIEGLGYPEANKIKVDTVYKDYSKPFQNAPGSGQATQQLLDLFNSAKPEAREAFNNNAHIPQMALNRLSRDEDWAQKWGATGQHFQNARAIIGEGPGWLDRLQEGLKKGIVLPAIAAGVVLPFASELSAQQESDQQQ